MDKMDSHSINDLAIPIILNSVFISLDIFLTYPAELSIIKTSYSVFDKVTIVFQSE